MLIMSLRQIVHKLLLVSILIPPTERVARSYKSKAEEYSLLKRTLIFITFLNPSIYCADFI